MGRGGLSKRFKSSKGVSRQQTYDGVAEDSLCAVFAEQIQREADTVFNFVNQFFIPASNLNACLKNTVYVRATRVKHDTLNV